MLATKARSDEITLSLPPGLAAPLADALTHLRGGPSGARLTGEPPHELTGPRALVRELLAVALDEAGERIGDASTRLLRGEDAAAELRALLSEASGLLALLEQSSAAP